MHEIIWEPDQKRINATNLAAFISNVNLSHNLELKSYEDLYRWSLENPGLFWERLRWVSNTFGDFHPGGPFVTNPDKMHEAQWYPNARLNYAENLLKLRDSEQESIVFWNERKERRSMTYMELNSIVIRLAVRLKEFGVKEGDRVAGYLPNLPETIIAMLATSYIGAIWSSCSPDFGVKGVVDRFGQIRPKVLFTADGYYYGGKTIDSLERVKQISAQLPDLEQIIVIPYVSESPDISELHNARIHNE